MPCRRRVVRIVNRYDESVHQTDLCNFQQMIEGYAEMFLAVEHQQHQHHLFGCHTKLRGRHTPVVGHMVLFTLVWRRWFCIPYHIITSHCLEILKIGVKNNG